jgi:tRNA A-37 threonylcarbamoyl transferase component Bud32/TolB-like protein
MTDVSERLRSALAGRYTIERELGSGGMATVYLAEDVRHQRRVAIKVLRPELAAALGPERFLTEIRVTANLTHPHILPLHDSGDADGTLYYVMPYVEGESLRERLRREGPLPLEDALQIARQVAQALGYAHSQGVIHRDIKPENILLAAGEAVVADFGVARAVEQAGGDRLTETGLAVGTPVYMSPEQASGERQLDGRSDLYSLACVLYEMLSGDPPITGQSVPLVLARKSTEAPPSLTTVRQTVPAAVDRAIQRALAPLPADRQRTAVAFAEELSAGTGHERVSPRARPAARRRVLAAAFTVAIAALALILWSPWSGGAAEPAVTEDSRVVVVPYDNRTGDPALDPIGHMVAEWVTEGLMQTGAVQVVPNVMALEAWNQSRADDGTVALTEVARRTASQIAVTGSFYGRGDDIEFHSQVVDVASGTPLATVDPIAGRLADPRGAIDSVRVQVMGALATRLSPLIGWELPPGSQPPTYEAYLVYQEGMLRWAATDYVAAARLFERAYALDTTHLRSLMLAASGYGNGGMEARSDSLLRMIEARRDQLAPYDRYRLEYAAANERGDREAALAAARRGVELVPYGTLRWAFTGSLISNNRPHEALESIEYLHPRFLETLAGWSTHWGTYTAILHLLGRHDRELEIAREGRRHIIGPLYGMRYQARALAALGRTEELTALVAEIVHAETEPDLTPGEALAELAAEARAHGQPQTARQIVDSAMAWLDGQPQGYREGDAGLVLRGQLLYLREDWDDAAAVFAALAADSAQLLTALGTQGTAAARTGDVAAARRFAAQIEALAIPQAYGIATRWRARITALLGERDEAVTLLRQAFREGLQHGNWLHRDMDLEGLRGYAPYEALVEPKG